jgi:hypothetical protein
MTDLAVRTYVLDIVIPVYNEESDLPGSIRRLHHYLATQVPYPVLTMDPAPARPANGSLIGLALPDGLHHVHVPVAAQVG